MLVRRLDSNHDMTFGYGLANYSTDAEACSQNVKTRLLLLQEEWFLDTTAGVPWLQQIMVKPADLALAESIIKERILTTEGIESIQAFDFTFDANTRKVNIACTVKTIYATVENIRVSI